MKLKFWKSNLDHDCKEHCGHARILEDALNEQIQPKAPTLTTKYIKGDQPSFAMENVDAGSKTLKPFHDCNKTCDHLTGKHANSPIIETTDDWSYAINLIYGRVNYEDDVDFVRFLKELLKIKKYQMLAKQFNLEFELSEDV